MSGSYVDAAAATIAADMAAVAAGVGPAETRSAAYQADAAAFMAENGAAANNGATVGHPPTR